MIGYILRRLLLGVPILLGVTFITFFLLNVFGGDPVAARLGKSASPEDLAALRAKHGLDQPLPAQYFRYLGEIARFDFGRSFLTDEPVRQILGRSIGPSLSITLPALVLTTLVSLTIASIAAAYRGRFIDRALMALAVLGMSVSFLVYIVAGQHFLAYKAGVFQIHGYSTGIFERIEYLLLPILISVIVGTGYDVRFYRAAIVEEADRLHVKTAKAKGLAPSTVMRRHVLRNSLIPIITRIMISVPFLITGSLLLEVYFGIPGLGSKVLGALNEQDYPVIKAVTVMVSFLFILGNVLTDVLYSWADPRVRLD
ncbi:MAG: ABC transporter permease [Acidobacteriota bacterium]